MHIVDSKRLLFLVGLIFSFGSADVYACRAPKASPAAVVDGAEVILRAEAERYAEAPRGDIRWLNEPPNASVSFKVKETLKGQIASTDLVLNGYLTTRDDFNDVEVPYDFVRPGGRGGSCSAYEYKRGAEFLLFLKKIDGKYTIRWYALAPTNEQLRSSDDKWISWVRNYINMSGRKMPVKK